MYIGASRGQAPRGAAPNPLDSPSPKLIAIPAAAQNFTASGAGPDVGEAIKPAGCVAAESTVTAITAIVVTDAQTRDYGSPPSTDSSPAAGQFTCRSCHRSIFRNDRTRRGCLLLPIRPVVPAYHTAVA